MYLWSMRSIQVYVVFLLVMCVAHTAVAQHKKKKKEKEEAVPVYNYVIDDPMDAFGRQPNAPDEVTTVLLPDFCTVQKRIAGDTVYNFEFYDRASRQLSPDTLRNPGDVYFISLIRNYSDPEHTYRDSDGKQQPTPIHKIVHRYDRTNINKWLTVDYTTNKSASYVTDAKDITRTDTVSVPNVAQGNNRITIYRYYKSVKQ